MGDCLAGVCRGLNSPAVGQLAAEAPVIAAEIGQDEGPHHPMLARRYGFQDLGSQAVPALDLMGSRVHFEPPALLDHPAPAARDRSEGRWRGTALAVTYAADPE